MREGGRKGRNLAVFSHPLKNSKCTLSSLRVSKTMDSSTARRTIQKRDQVLGQVSASSQQQAKEPLENVLRGVELRA